MDSPYSSRPHTRRNDQRQQAGNPNHPSGSGPVPGTVGRPQYANFARPFVQQPMANATNNRLRPPVALGVNRGSVTSIYSQASTGDRQSLLSAASGTRKHSSRLLQAVSNPDLASVHEEDVLSTNKSFDPSSRPLSRSKSEEAASTTTITPRPGTPEQDDKPLVSPITRSNSQWSRSAVSPEQIVRHTSAYRTDAITALSAAINRNIHDSNTSYPRAPKPAVVSRMPFEDSPESKSIKTDTKSVHSSDESGQLVNVPLYEHHTAADFLDSTHKLPQAARSPSTQSTNPLLESPIEQTTPSMSDKIPPHKRPAQLNMKAVREAESRGSLTSLPDLIRRATRLASNLDRGKTASRLGLDMMFATGSDKSSVKKRESTYSDVLFSFPAPGSSRPASAAQEHRSGTRHGEDKGMARANSRLMEVTDEDRDEFGDDEKAAANPGRKHRSRKQRRGTRDKRRCCGMSMTVFVILLVVLVIMIAAAILLPILLIWMPSQKNAANNIADCSRAFPCQNQGISIIDNNACSCICVDGFTGNQCGISRDPSCVTTTLREGVATYPNATAGSDIMSLLTSASPSFNIALNSTVLMSVFAQNNLSCSAENSLVRFSASAGTAKRFVIVSETQPLDLSGFPVAVAIEGAVSADKSLNIARAAAEEPPPAETSNDIVYQVSSSTDAESAAVPTPASTTGSASATITGVANATPSPTIKLTSQQIDFAQVVVLYVLQEIRLPNIAVNSQQILEQYLKAGGPGAGNATIDVVPKDIGYKQMTANFEQFSITTDGGSVVGGTAITN